MTDTYSCEIVNSSREFTAREQLFLEDTAGMQPINDMANGETIENVEDYAILKIFNPRLENPEYQTLVILAGNTGYYTSSEAFISRFEHIYEVMQGDDSGAFNITVIKTPSKNYKGKEMLLCKIAPN